jgi:hypothetical protein
LCLKISLRALLFVVIPDGSLNAFTRRPRAAETTGYALVSALSWTPRKTLAFEALF